MSLRFITGSRIQVPVGDSSLSVPCREVTTYQCLSYVESDPLVIAAWGVGLRKVLKPIRVQ